MIDQERLAQLMDVLQRLHEQEVQAGDALRDMGTRSGTVVRRQRRSQR